MSEFVVSCPSCGDKLRAYSEYVGRKAQCPSCGMRFIITNNVTPYVPPDTTRSDTEDTMKGNTMITGISISIAQRKPIITIALIATSIFATLIFWSKTGTIEPDMRSYVAYGANLRPLTFGGQWWRLVVSSFLHFDIKHLVMNMLCLYSIGCLLEKLIGHAKLLELYFLTAITGALASCIFHPNDVCAGASGAVFGLFGAEMAYMMILRKTLGLTSESLSGHMKSGIVFVVINFAYSLMPGVDMAAHVGGLLCGLTIGAVVASAVNEGNENGVVISRIISGIAILVAFGLAVSLVSGKNAGRLNIPELTAKVSQMLTEKLNKDDDAGGSFEVENLSLVHGTGNRYHGKAEITFKCGGKAYPLSSRIEVVHDAIETSYELNKEEFEEGLAGLQKALRNDSIDELKHEVSRILSENIGKGLRKEGYKNISVKVRQLSLTHDTGNKYHGNVELVCRYDDETETFKSRITVTYDGETIAYELKE